MTANSDRRGFLRGAVYSLWGVIAAAIVVPISKYVFSATSSATGGMIEVGDISLMKPGVPHELSFKRVRIDAWRRVTEKASVWVLKSDDGGVKAFVPKCTHLGCAYHWDDLKTEFVCPCHNSFFSKDGVVTAGPAPRPLDQYQAKVQNGKLFIDPSKNGYNIAS